MDRKTTGKREVARFRSQIFLKRAASRFPVGALRASVPPTVFPAAGNLAVFGSGWRSPATPGRSAPRDRCPPGVRFVVCRPFAPLAARATSHLLDKLAFLASRALLLGRLRSRRALQGPQGRLNIGRDAFAFLV